MFLKQEKPEMDDLEKRKTLVLKEKYLQKNYNILRKYFLKVFKGFPCKKFTKYLFILFCFRTFYKQLFLF